MLRDMNDPNIEVGDTVRIPDGRELRIQMITSRHEDGRPKAMITEPQPSSMTRAEKIRIRQNILMNYTRRVREGSFEPIESVEEYLKSALPGVYLGNGNFADAAT